MMKRCLSFMLLLPILLACSAGHREPTAIPFARSAVALAEVTPTAKTVSIDPETVSVTPDPSTTSTESIAAGEDGSA